RIDGGSGPGHPDAAGWSLGASARLGVRRCVPHGFLCEGARVVGHQPAVIGRVIAVTAPGNQHVAVLENQARALVLETRIECNSCAVTVLRGTGHRSLNLYGAAVLLGKRESTQSVEVLNDIPVNLRL